MKHLLFVVAALSASFNLVAADEPGFAIVPCEEACVYNILYEGEASANVHLRIIDSKGNTVIRKFYRSTQGFKLPVNFQDMNSDDYVVKLSAGKKKFTGKIEHKKAEPVSAFHVTRLSGSNRFLVSFKTPEATRLTLTIYDRRNDIIYQNDHEIDQNYATVVNTNKINGPFVFEVRSFGGSFRRIVNKD